MTPTEINAINRTLATFMGWRLDNDWWHSDDGPERSVYDFAPATNRNDLAEVAAKLTARQWSEAERLVRSMRQLSDEATIDLYGSDRTRYFLTCDPAIIAKAIAEIVEAEK